MKAASRACAPSGVSWDGINWADVQRQVRRLQARMVKAVQAGRHNKAKALQWLLTHSLCGKALAVKRVSGNKGKNTPGVDKVTWKTPAAKTNAIASLKRAGLFDSSASEGNDSEEKQQKDEASRHTRDEVPRHASITFASFGAYRGNHC